MRRIIIDKYIYQKIYIDKYIIYKKVIDDGWKSVGWMLRASTVVGALSIQPTDFQPSSVGAVCGEVQVVITFLSKKKGCMV